MMAPRIGLPAASTTRMNATGYFGAVTKIQTIKSNAAAVGAIRTPLFIDKAYGSSAGLHPRSSLFFFRDGLLGAFSFDGWSRQRLGGAELFVNPAFERTERAEHHVKRGIDHAQADDGEDNSERTFVQADFGADLVGPG